MNKKTKTTEEKEPRVFTKEVKLLGDPELELTAERYGVEYNSTLKEARLLSIIAQLEKELESR